MGLGSWPARLSEEQVRQVVGIQRDFRERLREAMPPPPGPEGPAAGPPPRGARERIEARRHTADDQIRRLLDADQGRRLERMVKDINDLRAVGIPLEAGPALELTGRQRARIGAIAARARKEIGKALDAARDEPRGARRGVGEAMRSAHEATMKVLTAEQGVRIERLARQSARRWPGRPGGPGSFGPGGPGSFGPGGPPSAGEGVLQSR